MRLGEILTEAGVLKREDVEREIRQDTGPSERIGSKLIRSGLASPDEVAIALGKQHGVMPALVRHLVHHDPQVLPLLSAKTSSGYGLLPIAFSKTQDRKLVVCFRNPAHKALRVELEKRLDLEVIPCVASEVTMEVYWEHYYNTPNSITTKVSAPADSADNPSGSYQRLELVQLDHSGVEKADNPLLLSEFGVTSALKMATNRAKESEQSPALSAESPSSPNPFTSIEDSLSSMALRGKRY